MSILSNLPKPPSALFVLANATAPLAAISAAFIFFAIAILGYTKDPSNWMGDFNWYYAGGYCFAAGRDMYDLTCFGPVLRRLNGFQALAGVAYPPHFGIITRLVAAPEYETSLTLYASLNLTVLIGLLLFTIRLIRENREIHKVGSTLCSYWAIVLILGSSGTWAAIWLGQLTPFLALSAWMAFRSLDERQDVLAGILLAILSFKPQLAALVFLWVLLNGRITALLWAAVIAGALSAYTFIQMGILQAMEGWYRGMVSYQDYGINRLGDPSVMGLPSLLSQLGINVTVPVATAIGAMVLVFLRMTSKRPPFSPFALATILLIQMCVFSRQYDTLLIAPAFALFWPNERSSVTQICFFFFGLIVFCMPQRPLMEISSFPIIAHFRTCLIVAMVVVLIRNGWISAPKLLKQANQ